MSNVTRFEMWPSLLQSGTRRGVQIGEYQVKDYVDDHGRKFILCGEALRELFELEENKGHIWVCGSFDKPKGAGKYAYQAHPESGGITIFGHPNHDDEHDPFDEAGVWHNLDDDTAEIIQELYGEYKFWFWLEVEDG